MAAPTWSKQKTFWHRLGRENTECIWDVLTWILCAILELLSSQVQLNGEEICRANPMRDCLMLCSEFLWNWQDWIVAESMLTLNLRRYWHHALLLMARSFKWVMRQFKENVNLKFIFVHYVTHLMIGTLRNMQKETMKMLTIGALKLHTMMNCWHEWYNVCLWTPPPQELQVPQMEQWLKLEQDLSNMRWIRSFFMCDIDNHLDFIPASFQCVMHPQDWTPRSTTHEPEEEEKDLKKEARSVN
jgi:hypothetical protein